MADEPLTELRQLLLETIVPDLKLIIAKVDGLRHQLQLSEQAIQSRIDALWAEMAAFRGEMKALRNEMDQFRAEFRMPHRPDHPRLEPGTQQTAPDGEEQTARPDTADCPAKRWVN